MMCYTIFPNTTHILCAWHIEKNVLANVKKYFKSNEAVDEFVLQWRTLVTSCTEESFKSDWNDFDELYSQSYKGAVDDIKRNWLPLKEKFLSCYIDKYLHLGSTCTSRVEGSHTALKKYLKTSLWIS